MKIKVTLCDVKGDVTYENEGDVKTAARDWLMTF